MRDWVVRTRRGHVRLTVDLHVLCVVAVVEVGSQRESRATDPTLETALVKKRPVFERSDLVVEVGRTLATEARLLHRDCHRVPFFGNT